WRERWLAYNFRDLSKSQRSRPPRRRQERDWQDDLCDAGQRARVVSITATVPVKHFYQLGHADDHGADVEKEAAQDAI
ncbi:MAG: hypothetical protein M0P30_12860, partial [Syntrophorhabdaceae bacterium]|nr:hypothetical protein [Syntrophorhabdaceae bacterium]